MPSSSRIAPSAFGLTTSQLVLMIASAATAWTIRLRQHEPDIGLRREALERGHRECRSPRESDADRVGQDDVKSLERYF